MHEPIEAYCRKGVVHFMLFPQCAAGEGPIVETFAQLASDPDLDVIEVGRVSQRSARRQIAEIAQTGGIQIACAAQPRILADRMDLGSAVESERQRAVKAVCEEIEAAVELRAKSLSLLSGPDPGPTNRDEAKRHLIRSLQEISEKASQAGLQILLEPFDREVDKKALIGPTAEAVDLWVRVERDNFGLMLDLSHLPLLGERPLRALPIARECLQHVHVGNCVLDRTNALYGDQHPPFGWPGGANGLAEVAEFLRVLVDIGFFCSRSRPTVSFEIKPTAAQSAELVLAGAKRMLRAAWLEA